jgi:hypothetical protein
MTLTRDHLPLLHLVRDDITAERELFICYACRRISERTKDEAIQQLAGQIIKYVEHELDEQPYLTSWVIMKMGRAGIPLPSLLADVPNMHDPRRPAYEQLRRNMRLVWLDKLIWDIDHAD